MKLNITSSFSSDVFLRMLAYWLTWKPGDAVLYGEATCCVHWHHLEDQQDCEYGPRLPEVSLPRLEYQRNQPLGDENPRVLKHWSFLHMFIQERAYPGGKRYEERECKVCFVEDLWQKLEQRLDTECAQWCVDDDSDADLVGGLFGTDV